MDQECPTPKANDNDVNASVMFPRGNIHDRGKVIGRKIDEYGNAIGTTNNNPILDTRKYSVDFDYGEVSELMANFIE